MDTEHGQAGKWRGADPASVLAVPSQSHAATVGVYGLTGTAHAPSFPVGGRDNNTETYWQSDGPQPHLINIQFHKKVLHFAIALVCPARKQASSGTVLLLLSARHESRRARALYCDSPLESVLVHAHLCVGVCVGVQTHICMVTYMHICVYVCVRVSVRVCVRVCV